MSARKNLIIDLVALAVFLVAANPALTGIPAHEWIGLALAAAFFVHVLVHVEGIAEALRSRARSGGASAGSAGAFPATRMRWAHLALDALIVLAFAAATVSGLCISGAVLPAFGYYAEGYYFWNPLHAVAAKALLALLLVHVVAHARWFASLIGSKRGNGYGNGSVEG